MTSGKKNKPHALLKRPDAPLGASLVVISSIFYASYGIWTKLMGDFFGGYTASALRSIIVLIIIVPVALFFHQLQPINWRRNWHHIVGMTVSSLFMWGPLYYAILHAGIGIALTINYACYIIGMFLFGRLFNGEQFTKDKWFSIILSLIGLFFVFSPNVTDFKWLALGAAVLSGISSSSVGVITKKIDYNTSQSTIFLWLTSVVANVCMAFVIGEKQPLIGMYVQWLYLCLFAIASVLASWTLVKGVKMVEAGAAGILGLFEIVFGVLFGIVFFDEHLSLLISIGVLIIITAAAIPYIKDYNEKRGVLEN
jgi:drug/metabolite transporter (DMT)-like permease